MTEPFTMSALTEVEIDHRPLIFALEGLAGSGKTHLGRLLRDELEVSGLVGVEFHKIGGLGEDLVSLREIRAERETLYREGRETERHKKDRLTDRIYHLAAVKQTRRFLAGINETSPSLVILDRTPFVGWAFAKAQEPNNPYLEKVYENNLTLARLVGIDRLFFLDVSAEETYARSFARYYLSDPNPLLSMQKAVEKIEAPAAAASMIVARTLELMASGKMQAKQFESWHFPSFAFTALHRRTYVEAMERARVDLGIELVIVDAERPIDVVLEEVCGQMTFGLREG